jgi:hypothetical protein
MLPLARTPSTLQLSEKAFIQEVLVSRERSQVVRVETTRDSTRAWNAVLKILFIHHLCLIVFSFPKPRGFHA